MVRLQSACHSASHNCSFSLLTLKSTFTRNKENQLPDFLLLQTVSGCKTVFIINRSGGFQLAVSLLLPDAHFETKVSGRCYEWKYLCSSRMHCGGFKPLDCGGGQILYPCIIHPRALYFSREMLFQLHPADSCLGGHDECSRGGEAVRAQGHIIDMGGPGVEPVTF